VVRQPRRGRRPSRSEYAAEPDAAQFGHRQHDEGDQADADGQPGEHHRPAAVFIAAITAEALSSPRARSSRHRVTTSSE